MVEFYDFTSTRGGGSRSPMMGHYVKCNKHEDSEAFACILSFFVFFVICFVVMAGTLQGGGISLSKRRVGVLSCNSIFLVNKPLLFLLSNVRFSHSWNPYKSVSYQTCNLCLFLVKFLYTCCLMEEWRFSLQIWFRIYRLVASGVYFLVQEAAWEGILMLD